MTRGGARYDEHGNLLTGKKTNPDKKIKE